MRNSSKIFYVCLFGFVCTSQAAATNESKQPIIAVKSKRARANGNETKTRQQVNTGRELFPIKTTWGEIQWRENGLELYVAKRPKNGVVTVPRLNNQIVSVYLKDDKTKKLLTFKPGTTEWAITLPKSNASDKPIVVVLETKRRVYVPNVPRVVEQSTDKSITLSAHDAVTYGEMLRYEPQPHKNTVGYWVNEKDWCQWHFTVEKPGKFDVHVLQGCGKGQGGSEVAVTIVDQTIKFIVEDTGHFQKFKDRKIGTMTIAEPGAYTLKIKPIKKSANAVMDVRRVRLLPIIPQQSK